MAQLAENMYQRILSFKTFVSEENWKRYIVISNPLIKVKDFHKNQSISPVHYYLKKKGKVVPVLN
jgi:hypothetical protein